MAERHHLRHTDSLPPRRRCKRVRGLLSVALCLVAVPAVVPSGSTAAGSTAVRSVAAESATESFRNGAPTRLNPPLAPKRTVNYFETSSDSKWVLFIADLDTDDIDELYSVPTAGGAGRRRRDKELRDLRRLGSGDLHGGPTRGRHDRAVLGAHRWRRGRTAER